MHASKRASPTTGLALLAMIAMGCDGAPTEAPLRSLAPEGAAAAARSGTMLVKTAPAERGGGIHAASHNATFQTTDLTTGLTGADLAQGLAGAGVVVSNVTYSGASVAGGTFTGGAPVGVASGIILTSGNVANVHGPNQFDGVSVENLTGADADLTALSGFPTYDATVLEFDFVPDGDNVYIEYVFGSEEYNEYVNTSFNDVFAFFVNGVNCALVGDPALPVSINSINEGNPDLGLPTMSNPHLYMNNDLTDLGTPTPYDTEMDGFTTVLVCAAEVVPHVPNHMKLAIADASDAILDSYVLLKAASFSTTPPTSLTIDIDIKPNSDPSSWACKNTSGSIPVAALSGDGFDATTLDAGSVRFGKDGDDAAEVHQKKGEAARHVEDVNGDGVDDMVFHFAFAETGFSCDDIPAGDKDATLTGTLTGTTQDGVDVTGASDIRLVAGK